MPPPEDLEVQIDRMIEKMLAAKGSLAIPITSGTTFDSLAIDSLDKINLSFEVEEAFGIEIPDTAIGAIRTVGEMAEGVRALILALPAA